MKRTVFHIIMVMMLAGCSIKEDRTLCPCTIMVDLSGMDREAHAVSDILVLTDGDVVLEDEIPAVRYSEPYVFRVRRVSTTVDIYSGWKESGLTAAGFKVDEGEQFPELYLQTERIDTDAESVSLAAGLHKSYCKVTIDIRTEGEYPYSLSVRGDACGYAWDGEIIRGKFEYSPALDRDGICTVRIPRQHDSSLALVISEEGNTLREFALGEYIMESGYDWTAKDLEDVEVEIDYAKTDVIFKVNDWETTISFDVII